MFTFYRSTHQSYSELCTFNIPTVIKSLLLKDDKTKCRQLAASIVAKKPYAINEQLFNDLFSVAAACRRALYEIFLPKHANLCPLAQAKFMKCVKTGDKCVLCNIPVDLCHENRLDKNREVCLTRCREIYRLACKRRTARECYEKLNRDVFISKLLPLNIYYEASKNVNWFMFTAYANDFSDNESQAAGQHDAGRIAECLQVELEEVEVAQKLFALAKIDTEELSFVEQIEEFEAQYNDYVRSACKAAFGEPITRRMFITMHAMSEDAGDYNDISPQDYQVLQNAYDDIYTVHHDHFSGMYYFYALLYVE